MQKEVEILWDRVYLSSETSVSITTRLQEWLRRTVFLQYVYMFAFLNSGAKVFKQLNERVVSGKNMNGISCEIN